MSQIYELESAISKLSGEEFTVFRDWFFEFDAEAWDKQFEADVMAGRLDTLADAVVRDLR